MYCIQFTSNTRGLGCWFPCCQKSAHYFWSPQIEVVSQYPWGVGSRTSLPPTDANICAHSLTVVRMPQHEGEQMAHGAEGGSQSCPPGVTMGSNRWSFGAGPWDQGYSLKEIFVVTLRMIEWPTVGGGELFSEESNGLGEMTVALLGWWQWGASAGVAFRPLRRAAGRVRWQLGHEWWRMEENRMWLCVCAVSPRCRVKAFIHLFSSRTYVFK